MPADWARINDLFHRALDVPSDRRAAWLDEACGGDDATRREVASLLDAHARAGDFIEKPGVSASDLLELDRGAVLVGRTLGQYRIRRVLGEGGMGIVYLADDTRLGRPVALKALPPRFTRDASRRERLMREARAAAGLTHPGIATVYALEEFDDQLYIACEYVPGATLRTELEHGALPVGRVIDAALQIVRALATAHELGIVHRDLKPENVIRTPTGALKVLDFGLARFRETPPSAALTGDGTVLGTPAYMSPEQIRGEMVDFRSDIFSIGIVMYELATGVHPFSGVNSASTIARILETEPRRLADFAAVLGPAGTSMAHLETVVTRCLQKPADARYRSTEELIAALERARASLNDARPGPVLTPTATPPLFEATGRRTPRWWWEFHQGAASLGYIALLAPMWFVHTTIHGKTALWLFIGALAATIMSSTLRLHLVFTVRSYPAQHTEQQRSARPWIRVGDWIFAGCLLGSGFLILEPHASVAMALIGGAVAVAISSAVIEPATTRAAFNR